MFLKKLIFSSFFLFFCYSFSEETTIDVNTLTDEQLLVQQTVMSVLWVKDSGEFEALSTQVYNSAKYAFLEYAKAHPKEKLAVILDVDDGVLNNIDYQINRIREGQGFTQSSWDSWIQEGRATAMPGAVEFVETVHKNGGEIFYLSNRLESQREITLINMINVGLYVDNDHLFMKEKPDNKKTREQTIESKGLKIVLYVADSLNNFFDPGELNIDRKAKAKMEMSKFGKEFFILPNPVYGAFEAGLSKNYYRNSSSSKIEIRNKKLNINSPKKVQVENPNQTNKAEEYKKNIEINKTSQNIEDKKAMKAEIESKIAKLEKAKNASFYKDQYEGIINQYKEILKTLDAEIYNLNKNK